MLVCKVKTQLIQILKCLKIICSTLPGKGLYSDEVLSKIFLLVPEKREENNMATKPSAKQQPGKEIASFLENYDLGKE